MKVVDFALVENEISSVLNNMKFKVSDSLPPDTVKAIEKAIGEVLGEIDVKIWDTMDKIRKSAFDV